MTVNSLCIGGKIEKASLYHKTEVPEQDIRETSIIGQLIMISALCNRASLDASGAIHGDASETALLRFCLLVRGEEAVENMRNTNGKLGEIPFNSKNKWQASIHKNSSGDISI